MAGSANARSAGAASSASLALRLLAVALGIFFVFTALGKIDWLANGAILLERFQRALPSTHPSVRWYLETIAIPGAPLFARLVPLAEFCAGAALVIGFWPRLVAGLALFMILNFHFIDGSYWSVEFLRSGIGLPVIGGLLALAIGGRALPWAVKP
ncbi:MAG: DoxX family membrane protein [Vicinamibacterales bacterium]